MTRLIALLGALTCLTILHCLNCHKCTEAVIPCQFPFNPAIRNAATRETVRREKDTKSKKTDTWRIDGNRPMHFSKTMIRIAKEALRQGIWGHSSAWVANQKKAICHWCFWADDAVCGLNRERAQQVGLIRQKAEQENCWLLFESCQYVCIWSVSFIWKFLIARRCTTSACIVWSSVVPVL